MHSIKKWERFIAAIAEGSTVQHACDAAGIARRAAYLRRKKNEEFASAWVEAIEAGTDLLEDECLRRAKEGVVRGAAPSR